MLLKKIVANTATSAESSSFQLTGEIDFGGQWIRSRMRFFSGGITWLYQNGKRLIAVDSVELVRRNSPRSIDVLWSNVPFQGESTDGMTFEFADDETCARVHELCKRLLKSDQE